MDTESQNISQMDYNGFFGFCGFCDKYFGFSGLYVLESSVSAEESIGAQEYMEFSVSAQESSVRTQESMGAQESSKNE